MTLVKAEQMQVVDSQVSSADVAGDLDAAIERVLAAGPKALVVKRGQHGAWVFSQGAAVLEVPGFPVEVYNTLGAGDAFASGLIYGYLRGWDWYKAARFGNATGAIIVTRHGCANFMPYEAEVFQFVQEHGGF
jgi:5-dehydro-2-deoxygluconokinase